MRRSDNLEVSVWKEACPPIKRIMKLLFNTKLLFCHAAAKQCPAMPILSLFVAAHYISAVPDSLPALPDHHANPDPGLAAVLRSVLPHRAGNWRLMWTLPLGWSEI